MLETVKCSHCKLALRLRKKNKFKVQEWFFNANIFGSIPYDQNKIDRIQFIENRFVESPLHRKSFDRKSTWTKAICSNDFWSKTIWSFDRYEPKVFRSNGFWWIWHLILCFAYIVDFRSNGFRSYGRSPYFRKTKFANRSKTEKHIN
jgi:hypothetical protein